MPWSPAISTRSNMSRVRSEKREVPVRSSELKSWASCRQKWYYEYQLGLQKIAESLTMARGTLGHASLNFLDAGQDPRAELLKMAEAMQNSIQDVELDDEIISFQAHRDAITDLYLEVVSQTNSYQTYWPRFEKIIATEQNLMFRMPGTRIPVSCTLDKIIEDENGLWVVERKWVKTFRSTDQMDLDGQLNRYVIAAKANGFDVLGVLVDQVGPPPKKPSLNQPDRKTGKKLMSRAKCGDWRTYKAALLAEGLDPEEYAEEMMEKLPYCSEFRRDYVYRSDVELANYIEDIKTKVQEVSSVNKTIYTCDDQIRCSCCQFRELCIERLKGGDVDYLMKTMFKQKTDDKQYKYQEDNT